jgi:ribosomal protein L1
MPDKEIANNVQAVMRTIERKLRRGIKNVRSVLLKATMGPPVKINNVSK